MRRALVAGEDAELRDRLAGLFTSLGFAVVTVEDGDGALAVARAEAVDVAAIDEARRDLDPAALRHLQRLCPLVVAAVQGEVLSDDGDSMETPAPRPAGGDAHLDCPGRTGAVTSAGDLEIDWRSISVRRHGEPVELSDQDLRLLCSLVEHAGEVLSRKELLHLVWGCGYLGESRMVDVAVCRLRQRIEDDPAAPRYVRTRRGQGYVFEPG